jgi:hypothetical protein
MSGRIRSTSSPLYGSASPLRLIVSLSARFVEGGTHWRGSLKLLLPWYLEFTKGTRVAGNSVAGDSNSSLVFAYAFERNLNVAVVHKPWKLLSPLYEENAVVGDQVVKA